MDPNYKTSKKILKEMAKHCGAIEVGFLLTLVHLIHQLLWMQICAL